MRARDIARDCESKAGVALVLIARIVQAHKWTKHFLAHVRRNAWPIVIDADGDPTMVAVAGDRNLFGKARGVRHQIAKAAPERGRAHGDDRMAIEHRAGLVAVP